MQSFQSHNFSNNAPTLVIAGGAMTTRRGDLVVSSDIQNRMAQDFADILKASPERIVTADDLLSKGWTRRQIDRHAHAATIKAQGMLALQDTLSETPVPPQDEASQPPGPIPAMAGLTPHKTLQNNLAHNDRIFVNIDRLLASLNAEVGQLQSNNYRNVEIIARLTGENA
jgi:hypothetical protein